MNFEYNGTTHTIHENPEGLFSLIDIDAGLQANHSGDGELWDWASYFEEFGWFPDCETVDVEGGWACVDASIGYLLGYVSSEGYARAAVKALVMEREAA